MQNSLFSTGLLSHGPSLRRGLGLRDPLIDSLGVPTGWGPLTILTVVKGLIT